MTIRKPNRAEEIRRMKNELETTEVFAASLVREAKKIEETRKSRVLTRKEYKRLFEVVELINEKNAWIAKARKTINAFTMSVA